MRRVSAGVLLYRRGTSGLEVLIAHPGGPLWANRDDGAWSIPKGQIEGDEDPRTAAVREFAEETGLDVGGEELRGLGEVTLKSGKVVIGFAVEGDLDPDELHSNLFEMEWPPHSGRRRALLKSIGWRGFRPAAPCRN